MPTSPAAPSPWRPSAAVIIDRSDLVIRPGPRGGRRMITHSSTSPMAARSLRPCRLDAVTRRQCVAFGCLLAAAVLTGRGRLHAAPPERQLAAARATAEEYVAQMEKRCYYPVTVPEILDGVVREMGTFGTGAERSREFHLTQSPPEEAWQVFQERLRTLTSQPGQRISPLAVVEGALITHSRTVDSWSRFISPEDVTRMEEARASDIATLRKGPIKARTGPSGGVGMTLREVGGDFFCYPFPDSPAQTAGIQPGDKLVSVNGQAVTSRPQELVAAWFQGAPGSKVLLQVRDGSGAGPARGVTIARVSEELPAVVVTEELGSIVLRIRRVPDGTANQILAAMKGKARGTPVTLDFRACPGGSLLAAADVARLFLDSGKLVLTWVERGQSPVEMRATEPARIQPSSISILQDEGTGSAAEIIIAALVENLPGVATSEGAPTRGKGVVQDPILLQTGGILRLTTGMLFGPSGRSWNGGGLTSSASATTAEGIYAPDAPSLKDPLARPRAPIKLVD